MTDKDQKLEENRMDTKFFYQEEDEETLPLAQITNLEEMAEFCQHAKPERTFGYGESGKSSDLVGETIRGKYKIVGLIAEGSSSNVFLCDRIMVDDRVALKMLSPKLASDT